MCDRPWEEWTFWKQRASESSVRPEQCPKWAPTKTVSTALET